MLDASRRSLGHALERPVVLATLATLIAFVLVALPRALGVMQGIELAAYDVVTRWNATAHADRSVVIVELSEAEMRRLGGFPLPDAPLARAVDALLDAGASAVGVNLYRDSVVKGSALDRALHRPNVVVAEQLPTARESMRDSVPPPAGLTCVAVGFTNVATDADGVLRRGMHVVQPDTLSMPRFSMAYQLAQLAAFRTASGLDESCPARATADDALFHRVLEPPGRSLGPNDGAYVRADMPGAQLLVDYPYAPDAIASLTFDDVLRGGEPLQRAVRGRVVLIGSAAASMVRPVLVPVGASRRVSGTRAQAHLVAQLLGLSRGTRSPMHTPTDALEWTWFALCAALGGLVAVRLRAPLTLALGITVPLAACWATAALALARSWWIPVVPPSLAFVASAGLTASLLAWSERRLRAMLMGLFARHLSPSLAADVWARRDEFLDGGRPRPQSLPATVLFADLRGYSTAAERADPALLMAWVNAFTEAMAAEVMRHGGVVDDYAGDGIKADFGVPVPRRIDDEIRADARAAAACALAMADALTRFNDAWRGRGIGPAAMRIGIHSGDVVAGTIGGADRLKYTIVGDTVNTAARLESLDASQHDFAIAPCRILVSDATAALLDGADVALESLGTFTVKGRAAEVSVHRLTRASPGVVPPHLGVAADDALVTSSRS